MAGPLQILDVQQWAGQMWPLVSQLFHPMGRLITNRQLVVSDFTDVWREKDLEGIYTRRFYFVLGSERSYGESDIYFKACTVWVSWEAWDVGCKAGRHLLTPHMCWIVV